MICIDNIDNSETPTGDLSVTDLWFPNFKNVCVLVVIYEGKNLLQIKEGFSQIVIQWLIYWQFSVGSETVSDWSEIIKNIFKSLIVRS